MCWVFRGKNCVYKRRLERGIFREFCKTPAECTEWYISMNVCARRAQRPSSLGLCRAAAKRLLKTNDFVKPKDQREFIRFGLARIFVQASAIELAHIAERSRKCQKEIALLRTFQCAVFLLHFGHSPCSTYEASVILYPSGTPASGTGTERRHTVCPQRTQRK